jgi:hypothetical protein
VFEGFRWSVGRGEYDKHLTYNDAYKIGVYKGLFVPLVSGFCINKSTA